MNKRNQIFKLIKDKTISILCMILILLTNMSTYTDVFAHDEQEDISSSVNDNSELTVNDEDFIIMDDKNLRKTESMENLNWIRDMSTTVGNIDITNGGKTIKMIGNDMKAGKNAIYIIPEVPQEQTLRFDYNIDFGDSFSAAGVMMNVRKVGNNLEGYMLSFNNDTWRNMYLGWYKDSGEKTGAIWKFTYELGANLYGEISRTLVKAIDLPKIGSLQVKSSKNQIIITGIDGTNINETIEIPEQIGYGFGFFSEHFSHGCPSVGHFNLENCVYTEVNLVPHNLYVDPNGGTWRNSSNVSVLEGITGDTYSIEVPVRSGYTFTGWKKIGASGTISSLTGDAVYTFGEDEETDDRLIAQWIKIDATKQSNITTGKVAENQEITYTITATNTGTVDGNVLIKDSPPEGTIFVPNSIMINGSQSSYTQENLASGINVTVPKPNTGQASGSSTLSFKVRVNKLANNALIKNTAQYKDVTVSTSSQEKTTNEIVLKYVEPIISQSKSQLTQNKESFVVNGEKVTYTIDISNDGGLSKEVVVKDNIPEGTTFVAGSVKINGIDNSSIGETELRNGIKVTIPEETKNQTVSFDVIVNDINDEDIIRNIATVDDKQTNEVTLRYVEPIISQRKKKETENNLDYVVNGEKIKYTITLENAGGLGKDVIVKDKIPEGTTFVEGSIRINGQTALDGQEGLITKEQLENGITVNSPEKITKTKRSLANSNMLDVLTDTSERDLLEDSIYEPSVTTISFEVTVNDINDEDIILNTATVDDNSTNTVSIRYVEPIISQKKEMETENNSDYVVNGEKIKYTVTVENAGGLAKDVVVKDLIPEGTTFVEGSVQINNQIALDEEENNISKAELESGIIINSPKKLTKEQSNLVDPDIIEVLLDETENSLYEPSVTTISFEVTVDDINDEDIISNTALVDEKNTNEVSIKYIEPIISMEKTAQTQYNKEYVTGEETIRYDIIVSNDGSLEKKVIIQDKIPEGVTFIKNSIKVNGEPYQDETNGTYDETDLEKGIEVLVPPKKDINEDTKNEDKENTEEKTPNESEENDEEISNKDKEKMDEKPNDDIENTEDETSDSNKENTDEKASDQNTKNIEKEMLNEDKSEEQPKIRKVENDSEEQEDSSLKENDSQENDTIKEDNEQKEEDEEQKKEENEETNEKKYNPGKTILSFEVIVNKLEKDTDTAKIVNIATVDGEKTNEVTHEVLPFNMKIEEKIKEVSLNGANQNVGDGKMMKTEVHAKTVNTASVITKYKILVTNTGKVEGTATIQDSIPKGYKIANTNPTYWKNTNDGKIQTTTEVIKPGESKTLEVALAWQNGQSNFGKKINKAEIIETKNESNAPETTLQDNKSESTVLMSIRTGEINNNYIIVGVLAISSMILLTGIIAIKKKVLG